MTWRGIRERPTSAAAWTLFVAIAAAGCGDDTGTGASGGSGGNGGEGAGQQGGEAPQGGGGQAPIGGGGTGGEGGGNTTCTLAEEADSLAPGTNPYDATPSPNGCSIFYTAFDTSLGVAGVFAVQSGGGGLATLASGDPFVSPFGIATGTDGTKLYVADPAADEGGLDGGMIFRIDAVGGTPISISGTEGLYPRSVEVREEGGADKVYFTGRNAAGKAAIFKINENGGTANELASAGSLVDPSGITISSTGDIFFVDTAGGADHLAVVRRLSNGSSTPADVVTGLHVGYPAGIAISQDDATLYVSGLDADKLHDVIFIIDVADGVVTSTYVGDADTPLDGFQEAAGLHRAKDTSVFAFVDSTAGGDVFAIQQ